MSSINPICGFEISTIDGAVYDDGERFNVIHITRFQGEPGSDTPRHMHPYFRPTRSSLRRVARLVELQIFGSTTEEKRQAKAEATRISQLELTVIQLKAKLYDLIASK